jgi:hypothetical protein
MTARHNTHQYYAANATFVCVILSTVITAGIGAFAAAPSRIKVSENKRFLVTAEGKPFFYLGDTAWELFHRLSREEAERYLNNRAEKRFTVIQAVVLAELDGLRAPNAYGHVPLKDLDPTKPNEDYFKHVDWIVNKANELGLVIGMLPTWGDKWHKPGVFTPENAATYGQWLGSRYKDKSIIWILGGDRNVENDTHKAILHAMAKGLRQGDGGKHLITFHPRGGQSSSTPFHEADWLDFNMWQNGHADVVPAWERIAQDYNRTPTKPVMDGEPIYEDHPISFKPKELGYSTAADVRRLAYWDTFSGAHGHTYGNHSVWQMFDKGRQPINGPIAPWHEVLDHPGAAQMQHVRSLLESRPFLTRVPAPSFIVTRHVAGNAADRPTVNPGHGLKRMVATRSSDGAYAMVYVPASRPFEVEISRITGGKAKGWWYDPRSGEAKAIGEFEAKGTKEFTPPNLGEMQDWVLVLDDVTKNFPPPGTMAK